MQSAMIRSNASACSTSAPRSHVAPRHAISVSRVPLSSSRAFSGATAGRRQGPAALRAAPEGGDAAAAAAVATESPADTREIRELVKEDYYTALKEAGDTLVVVDFFTSWCGPCKAMMPKLLDLQDKYAGEVVFTKLNCNKANKDLGVALGIKVAPTFHLYRDSHKVAEMTGAKVDQLVELIEKHK